jgi:hypothetical protein
MYVCMHACVTIQLLLTHLLALHHTNRTRHGRTNQVLVDIQIHQRWNRAFQNLTNDLSRDCGLCNDRFASIDIIFQSIRHYVVSLSLSLSLSLLLTLALHTDHRAN